MIDPTIFLRGYQGPVDTQQIFDRARLLRDQQRRASINDQLGQQQIQEGQLRLNQIGKQIQDQEAMKQAAMGAVKPVTPQYTPPNATLLSPTVAGPTTQQFDPNAYQSNLANAGFPLEAAAFQQQQEAAARKQQMDDAEIKLKLAQADKATQDTILSHLDMVGRKAQAFSVLPPEAKAQAYPAFKQDMEQSHNIPVGALPDQYTPQVDQILQSTMAQSQSVKDFIAQQQQAANAKETQRHNQAVEQQSANTFAESQRHNKVEEGLRVQELNKKNSLGDGVLSSAEQSLVDEIGTGKMAMGKLEYLAARNPDLLAAVSARYPDFDQSKVKSYTQATRDFTGAGKIGIQLNAGSTAMRHFAQLKKINDENPTTVRIPGSKANKAYENLLDTVAGEVLTFYGTPKTNETIASVKGTLGGLMNRDAAISEQALAMGQKFDELENTWKNAAPSPAYQAPMPGYSEAAKQARASLDPEYAARLQAEGGAKISVTDPAGGVHLFPNQAAANAFKKAAGIR